MLNWNEELDRLERTIDRIMEEILERREPLPNKDEPPEPPEDIFGDRLCDCWD